MRLSFVLDTVENPSHTDRLVPTWMERDATLEMRVSLHTSSAKRPPFASLSESQAEFEIVGSEASV